MNKPTWTIVILFAGIVSALSAGDMLAKRIIECAGANVRALEERNREELQRLIDSEAVKLERARAEDARRIRIINEGMRAFQLPAR